MSGEIRGMLSRHEPLVTQQLSDPDFVGIRKEHLRELWELAHEAVHPPEEDDEPTIERGYDEVSLRMQSIQFAQQMELSRLHSVENYVPSDPLMLAEAYLAFLKGGVDVPHQG